MLSTHLRCPKTLLYLTAIAALLFNAASSSQADEPQIVELTIMFRIPVTSLETFPLPFGEDAIGIVLDGDQNPPERLLPRTVPSATSQAPITQPMVDTLPKAELFGQPMCL